MRYNLEGKIFTSLSNTQNSEVNDGTLLYYHQEGKTVWADYEGRPIVKGHLIANDVEDGKLDMRYRHVNADKKIMIEKCLSTPEKLEDGRLKFRDKWKSSVYSQIVEVDSL
jgi:hypothetical protein